MQSFPFILKANFPILTFKVILFWMSFMIHGSETIIFKACQEHEFSFIPLISIKEAFERVHQFHEQGVFFNPSRLARNLYDGTCTAMTLGFLDAYISRMKGFEEQPGESDFHFFEEKFKSSTIEMICLQIALNCIEVDSEVEVDDISRAKVQALASVYQMEIDCCSDFVDIRDEDALVSFEGLVGSLSPGFYLIRQLYPADNHKREVKGHSMAYVKGEGFSYFYDPNEGLYEIFSNDFVLIHRVCLTTYQNYGVYSVRFYRLCGLVGEGTKGTIEVPRTWHFN